MLDHTIREDMYEESRYMRSHAQARNAIKDIIEMPDVKIDRVIRSVEANQGKLSNALTKETPALSEDGVWPAMVAMVQGAFTNGSRQVPNRMRC